MQINKYLPISLYLSHTRAFPFDSLHSWPVRVLICRIFLLFTSVENKVLYLITLHCPCIKAGKIILHLYPAYAPAAIYLRIYFSLLISTCLTKLVYIDLSHQVCSYLSIYLSPSIPICIFKSSSFSLSLSLKYIYIYIYIYNLSIYLSINLSMPTSEFETEMEISLFLVSELKILVFIASRHS